MSNLSSHYLLLEVSSCGWSFSDASRPRPATVQCSVLTVLELESETLSPVTTSEMAGMSEWQAPGSDVNCPSPDAAADDATGTCKDIHLLCLHTVMFTLTHRHPHT